MPKLPPGQSKPFLTRELTPLELHQLQRHIRLVDALHAANAQDVLDWRELTKRDLSKCPHTSGTIVEVENKHGYWGVEICNDCGEATLKECPHAHCSWHLDGKVLVCDNCGVDCT